MNFFRHHSAEPGKSLLLLPMPFFAMLILDSLLILALWGEDYFLKTLVREGEESLAQKAKITAAFIQEQLLSGKMEPAIQFCRDFGSRTFRITLISPDGTVLADTVPRTLPFDNHSRRSEFIAVKEGKAGFAKRYSSTLKQRMIYYALPVRTPHGLYILRFAKEDSSYMAIFPWITGTILVLLVIVSAFLGYLQFYLVNKIYRPLLDVGQCAHDISTGKSDCAIPVPADGPVKPLAEILAKMTEQLKNQLREMKKMETFRSDFIANISHEIKTPLTCIVGAVETIHEERDLPKDQYAALIRLLGEQSMRLNMLVKDILSLAALENNPEQQRQDFLPVELSEILRNCQKTFSDEAARKNMKIKILPMESVSVWGDAQLLEQAVANLVDNAIKYSSSPVIKLGLRIENSMAVISVADCGIGIPAEHHGRIFERFYRIHKERSRASGGTGLGLAIVKHTAQLHGGRAELQAVPQGGCCFQIFLPLSGPLDDCAGGNKDL